MRKKDFEIIRRKLQVFGLGKLQDLVTLLGILEREKIALKEVEKYVEYTLQGEKTFRLEREKQVKEMQSRWNKGTRRCPTCMSPLFLSPVREPKGKANVKGYTCLWYCSSEECKFEEYSKEDHQKLYKKIMGGR